MSADALPALHAHAVARPRGRGEVALEPAGTVQLVEADADLAQGLPTQDREFLRRRAAAISAELGRGRWIACNDPLLRDDRIALLVLDGFLVQHVGVEGRRTAELLGIGDLLRPRHAEADVYATVFHKAEWSVIEPVRVALIGPDLMAGLGRIPEIVGELAGREARRTRSLALRLALMQMPNLEARLELLLWHLADRWGRRQRGRVVLPIRLTQGILAEMAGAKRTSVNAAVRMLEERGALLRSDMGTWSLPGEPPSHVCSARL